MTVQFLRFSAVGIINTCVGLAIIFALMRAGNANYIVANAIGYLIGFFISFSLNRSWTFDYRGPVLQSAIQWLLLVCTAYVINISIVIVAHEYININQYISQLMGVAAYTVTTFFGGRYYVFSEAKS